jgi:mRNA-degrading endonuclease RelE of RelBE toxin-antitoxin system
MNLRVIGSPEFDSQHKLLKASAEKGNGASQSLLKKIDKAISKLKTNYHAGKHVPKDRVPAFYVINYGVENLWKLNIDPDYRLIYTIRGTDIEVMSVILEYLDHKEYNKRFGYKD